MMNRDPDKNKQIENREWINSLKWVLDNRSEERVKELLTLLQKEAKKHGIEETHLFTTPYINSIQPEEEVELPVIRSLKIN